jgi:hypothetical protein
MSRPRNARRRSHGNIFAGNAVTKIPMAYWPSSHFLGHTRPMSAVITDTAQSRLVLETLGTVDCA